MQGYNLKTQPKKNQANVFFFLISQKMKHILRLNHFTFRIRCKIDYLLCIEGENGKLVNIYPLFRKGQDHKNKNLQHNLIIDYLPIL